MIILITDTTHKDHNTVIYRTRPCNDSNKHIEYRDGGIWSRLHISQYKELKEDESGRLYYKCNECYGTGNGSAYIAEFNGRNVIHTISGCNSECYSCSGHGVIYL